MSTFLFITAGPLFVVSLAIYIYAKLCLRPKSDSDIDEYYYEVEEQHPGLARYHKWSKISFLGAVIGALLLFIAIAV